MKTDIENPKNTFSINASELALRKSEIEDCLSNTGVLSKKEIEEFKDFITIKSFKKGTHLLQEGEVSSTSYGILKGCVRQYSIIEGEEKTTFFYTEGQSIFSTSNPSKKIPAKHFLCCIEDTILTALTMENQKEMYKRFPKIASLSRDSLQEEIINYQEMLATYITTCPEERYQNLLKHRPELLKRVPQYQLASYLGVKPESLSRIRKRIFLNQSQ